MDKVGTLDIITGPMFSGKTSELLRRLSIESTMGLDVLYINNSLDNRSCGSYSTHNPFYEGAELNTKIDFLSCRKLGECKVIPQYDVVGIDECQFFDDLKEVVETLVEKNGMHVIIAGLNGDHKRNKFGQILDLEPFADSYERLTSFCKICSNKNPPLRSKAQFSKKINYSEEIEDIGGEEKYLPVCRSCYLS